MIFWLAAAIMTVGAILLILLPFLRKNIHVPPRVDFDLEIYRDQLRELENEKDRGLIDEEQSKAAKVEIERRMLTAVKDSDASSTHSVQEKTNILPKSNIFRLRSYRSLLTISMLVVVPTFVIPIYLYLGSPEKPGEPFLESAGVNDVGTEHNSVGQTMEVAINNLRQRLIKTPEDLEGWFLLGRSFIITPQSDLLRLLNCPVHKTTNRKSKNTLQ